MQGFGSQIFRKLLRSSNAKVSDALLQNTRTLFTAPPLHSGLQTSFTAETQQHVRQNSQNLVCKG